MKKKITNFYSKNNREKNNQNKSKMEGKEKL